MDEFIDAIIKNDIEKVRDFLKQNINPNVCEDRAKITPLHFAVQYNSIESALALINAGANIHAECIDGQTPLDIAKLHGHKKMTALLESSICNSTDIYRD